MLHRRTAEERGAAGWRGEIMGLRGFFPFPAVARLSRECQPAQRAE